jgi:hypothetical protein
MPVPPNAEEKMEFANDANDMRNEAEDMDLD